MIYYRVKPESDQVRVNNYKNVLFIGELKTATDLKKLNLYNQHDIEKHFDKLITSKKNIRFLFGSRFLKEVI